MFLTASKFPNFHSRPYTQCMKPGYLPGRNPQCVYCTEKAIVFLGSPYPQLPFDITIALMQGRYHCFRQLRSFFKFPFSALYAVHETGLFLGRNVQCVHCTGKAIAFLGSPYPQLPFDLNISLVQKRCHCFRQLRNFSKFPFSALYAVHEPGLFTGS